MEKKVLCYYCGTAYEETRSKCPLCGSAVRSQEAPPPPLPPRRRITEKERRSRRKKQRGRYTVSKAPEKSTRPILLAALVFLALAVFVGLFFIGDMIGWWPGLEDSIAREEQSAQELSEHTCTMLLADAKAFSFAAPGETQSLTVTLNLDCEDTLYCSSENEEILTISQTARTQIAREGKSAEFTLTALSLGETEILLSCGEKHLVCKVRCGSEEELAALAASQQPELDEAYVPALNGVADLSFFARGEKSLLKVSNLPVGGKVRWYSENPAVAKVNAYGEVSAIGGGKTRIIADVGGRTAQVVIRCNFDGYVDSGLHLQSGRSDVTVRVGERFSLFLYDSDSAVISDAKYVVNNPSVCKVVDGYVEVIGRGTTTVTVVYGEQSFECIVRAR